MNLPAKKENIRKLLRQVHQKKENFKVSDHWKDTLMRRLRATKFQSSSEPYSLLLARFIWRLAPVIAMLILALGAVLIVELASGDAAYQILMSETEELFLMKIF